jgi:hypothetical protein
MCGHAHDSNHGPGGIPWVGRSRKEPKPSNPPGAQQRNNRMSEASRATDYGLLPGATRFTGATHLSFHVHAPLILTRATGATFPPRWSSRPPLLPPQGTSEAQQNGSHSPRGGVWPDSDAHADADTHARTRTRTHATRPRRHADGGRTVTRNKKGPEGP